MANITAPTASLTWPMTVAIEPPGAHHLDFEIELAQFSTASIDIALADAAEAQDGPPAPEDARSRHGVATCWRSGRIASTATRSAPPLPGFVNTRYHSHDVQAKGTLEEVPLDTWRLYALPPQCPPRSAEEVAREPWVRLRE